MLGQPSTWTRKSDPDFENKVYYGVMALSFLMAVSFIGWPGIFLAMFAAPGMAKQIAKMSRGELFILGVGAAVLYSGLGEVGFFAALFALPGIVRSVFSD